jgi:hypothetical protein
MKLCGGSAQASSVPLLPTRYGAKNNEENFFHAPKLRQPVGAQRQRPDVDSDKNPTGKFGKSETIRPQSLKIRSVSPAAPCHTLKKPCHIDDIKPMKP